MLALKKPLKLSATDRMRKKVLLNKIDLSLKPGEFVTVVGGNGAGKSVIQLHLWYHAFNEWPSDHR